VAESAAHRFGQIIGDLLEEILEPELRRFCESKSLFLDRKGLRPDVRSGKKVSWEDKFGNRHDLDFVVEKPAEDDTQGRPLAFIEAAWRRYTKHSRNKAQEIQGAIVPLAETYSRDAPFLGAVLAGEFTAASLEQLRSHGFAVVHFAYADVVRAFRSVGIDASFDESTPDKAFRACISKIGKLSRTNRTKVKEHILASRQSEMAEFLGKLKRKLERHVERVIVIPLFGESRNFESAGAASTFLAAFDTSKIGGKFRKFEVRVSFSNEDSISGEFSDAAEANRFLDYVVA